MVKNYKCPSCGASMEFDSQLQKMHCDHCGTTLSVEELDDLYKDGDGESKNNFKSSGDFNHSDKKTEYFNVYKCPSCGAEVMTDENTAATFCSFCGNPGIMLDRVQGELSPDGIIPFKLNKEQAKDIYRKWTKKGALTPSSFRTSTTIEKITGMYVPFWLYDYNADANITAHCTRVFTERHGDTEHIHTDNFRVTRDVSSDYNNIPTDASEKMPDDVMDMLEPFNYSDMSDFEMPYLSGYYAEKYNYTKEELAPRAETRVHDYILDAARSTIQGYTTTNITHSDIDLRKKDAKYTLFPVWVLNYRYKDKDYMFTINGQTGKVVGKLPISKKRAFGYFTSIAAVSFVILTLLGGLLG